MAYWLSALVGYGLGCINPSYMLARFKGFDIRNRGSKNAGASNVLISVGIAAGILCAVLDVGKAVVAVWLTERIFPEADTFAVTAVSCILGHIFPFYLHFCGGKGLACLSGAVLAFDLRVFVILLIIELFVAFLTKYICYVPMTASILFSFVYVYMTGDLWGSVLLGGTAIVILYKHLVNLRRILEGRELRLSYLWDREGEIRRICEQYPGYDDP